MKNEQTNEQKARELGQKYQTPCHGIGDCEFEAYKAAMEMAEWKEQQMLEHRKIIRNHWQNFYEEQKQLLIEKAAEWLINNTVTVKNDNCEYTASSYDVTKELFIEEFKKAMEE